MLKDMLKDNIPKYDKVMLIGAFITLVVFFFQLTSLVQIEVLEQKNKSTNQFSEALFDVFDFRFPLYGEICPGGNLR